jgi:hypothetical protein
MIVSRPDFRRGSLASASRVPLITPEPILRFVTIEQHIRSDDVFSYLTKRDGSRKPRPPDRIIRKVPVSLRKTRDILGVDFIGSVDDPIYRSLSPNAALETCDTPRTMAYSVSKYQPRSPVFGRYGWIASELMMKRPERWCFAKALPRLVVVGARHRINLDDATQAGRISVGDVVQPWHGKRLEKQS